MHSALWLTPCLLPRFSMLMMIVHVDIMMRLNLTPALLQTHYDIIVREESRVDRPRLRYQGAEPFVDAVFGLLPQADGSWRFRIRFPKNGEVKPMVAKQGR